MSKTGPNGIPLCPQCGEEATGTVETVVGIASIQGVEGGQLRYSGGTDIDWDTQHANRNDAGEVQWWCAACHEHFFAPLPLMTDTTLLEPTFAVVNPWRTVGEPDPASRLLTTVLVNGVEHHLEAYEVVQGKEGQEGQEGSDEVNEEVLLEISAAIGVTGPWLTTPINGREYVLVMTPHCD